MLTLEQGKRYRLLPHPGNKTELYNALVEPVHDWSPQAGRPLVRVVKVHRRSGHCGGALIHAGDILRLLPDDQVQEVS